MEWRPFYFDGNQVFDEINSREDWREVVEIYKEIHRLDDRECADFLRRAKYNPGSEERYGMPRFGFYAEYIGPKTLGEWADREKVNLYI